MTFTQNENKRTEATLKEYIGSSTAIYNGKELKVALFTANINSTNRIIKLHYEENFVNFFKKRNQIYKLELLQLDENLYDF